MFLLPQSDPHITCIQFEVFRTGSANAELAERRFGLTKTEAKLATSMCNTGSLGAAARACELPQDVAEHLQASIFKKTKVTAATDLLPLLSSPDTRTFLYDPEENVNGVALNDRGLDSNQFFGEVVSDPSVISARARIAFEHSFHTSLPVLGARKFAGYESMGALIGAMFETMVASGEFDGATSENQPIFHLAALTGRQVAPTAGPRAA